ncbi:MAG: hypothetical protein P8X76_03035 [Maritimibacter sp.]
MTKLSQEARRAAKTAWRERKQDWVICAVRIGGSVWVELTPDARALENRIGFMLRQGSEAAPGMRAAYAEEGALSFEIVEKLEEDLSPLARERIGEERLKYWSAQLSARIF